MSERPLRATNHCRHYSYESAPRCAAGVVMDGPVLHCLPNPPNPHACLLREEYTDAEREAWKAWMKERMARMLTILAEIPGSSRDKKNKPEWGKSGRFPCPACKTGEVRWSRSSYNGHVRAACSTEDCFSVIE